MVEVENVLRSSSDLCGIVLCAHDDDQQALGYDYVSYVLSHARLGMVNVDMYSSRTGGFRQKHLQGMELAHRLQDAYGRLREHVKTRDLPTSVFCSGGGLAAALHLAASHEHEIAAIVSRAGHADLAMLGMLARISTPTLLIVGSLDESVISSNRAAYAALRCKKRLEIIPGVGRFFEEAGSVEVVARLVRTWLLQHCC